MCADNALLSDLSVIENGRSHSDKTPIADRASVDDSSVSNGDIFTDEGRGHAVACVYEGVFLEIRPAAYLEGLDVASKYSVKKDRDVVADSGVANYPSVRRHKSRGADHRGFLFEGNNRHVQRLAVFLWKGKPIRR
jgi:hypothetical protein